MIRLIWALVLVGSAHVGPYSFAQLIDVSEEEDRLGQVMAAGDFNGDGFLDLAIGVPEEDVGEIADAGAVHVIHGSAAGLVEAGQQYWSQEEKGVPNDAGVGELFGASLAAGDVNGDGFDDLTIGVPGEVFGAANEAGAVLVLLGSDRGLTTSGNQYLSQTLAGMPDQAEDNDRFGAALSVGDFNDDGIGDLAVGIPGENVGAVVGAGAVHVFLGATAGFEAARSQFFHQETTGISDTAEGGDGFGASLTSGDFNGDTIGDLAVGVPEEDLGGKIDAGALHVLFGSASGPSSSGSLFLHQDAANVEGDAATNEQFSRVLIRADFDGDGFEDLAASIAFEAGSAAAAGSVQVMYGSTDGPDAGRDEIWNQDVPALSATAGAGDLFGFSLAGADFDGDGFDDLAIGTPGKTVQGLPEAGGVYWISGSAGGLTAAESRYWTQDDGGSLERNESGDQVGAGLLGADFDADGAAELLIGVPQEDAGSVRDSGKLHLLPGTANGPNANIARDWAQNSLPERPELVDPEEEETILVGGGETPIDPSTPFTVIWAGSSDADGHTVTYYWQLSLTPTFNVLPMVRAVGTATRYETTVGEIGGVLRAIGVLADSSFTFYHRVVATDGRGQSFSTPYAVTFTHGLIVANEIEQPADAFGLTPNYPNPFSGATAIGYFLEEPAAVQLDVYNILGQHIHRVVDAVQAPGRYEVAIDLSNQPSGVFIVRLRAGSRQVIHHMTLVR
jgi:hypothetical protein